MCNVMNRLSENYFEILRWNKSVDRKLISETKRIRFPFIYAVYVTIKYSF